MTLFNTEQRVCTDSEVRHTRGSIVVSEIPSGVHESLPRHMHVSLHFREVKKMIR